MSLEIYVGVSLEKRVARDYVARGVYMSALEIHVARDSCRQSLHVATDLCR